MDEGWFNQKALILQNFTVSVYQIYHPNIFLLLNVYFNFVIYDFSGIDFGTNLNGVQIYQICRCTFPNTEHQFLKTLMS